MSGCNCEIELKDKTQRKVLIALLAINGAMFVLELGIGIWADSTGLIADSLDMLADAMVYTISLYAVGHAITRKLNAAMLSGIFQLLLGIGVILQVIHHAVYGSDPNSTLMMSMGGVAMVANLYCLKLIYHQRYGEAHMRASWVFSCNDVIANAGVIIGGLLVLWLENPTPDLVIGSIIAVIIVNGGYTIIKNTLNEKRALRDSK